MNRFLYAEGNPWTLVDPSGHMAGCASASSDLCNETTAVKYKNTPAGKAAAKRVSGRDWDYTWQKHAVGRSQSTRDYDSTPTIKTEDAAWSPPTQAAWTAMSPEDRLAYAQGHLADVQQWNGWGDNADSITAATLIDIYNANLPDDATRALFASPLSTFVSHDAIHDYLNHGRSFDLVGPLLGHFNGWDRNPGQSLQAGGLDPSRTVIPVGLGVAGVLARDVFTSPLAEYTENFYRARPDLRGLVDAVHHSIPQRYRALMDDAGVNIDDPAYLRGVGRDTHTALSNEWSQWNRAQGGTPTAEEVVDFAGRIDVKYGGAMEWPFEMNLGPNDVDK